MKTTHSYQEAFEELQELIAQIEAGDVSIDVLSTHVKRAMILIDVCKMKLHATEQDVQELLKQLDQHPSSTEKTEANQMSTQEENATITKPLDSSKSPDISELQHGSDEGDSPF